MSRGSDEGGLQAGVVAREQRVRRISNPPVFNMADWKSALHGFVAGITVLAVFLFSAPIACAALSAGDIFILGFNADGDDDFSFITFVEIPDDSEVLYFTDDGITNGALRGSEGVICYTPPPTGLASGTVVVVLDPGGASSPDEGSAVEVGSFNMSGSGDQLIVFQTNGASTNFIFALNTHSTGWFPASSTTASDVPPGLTEGVDAIHTRNDLGSTASIDCGRYINGLTGDVETLKTLFRTGSFWEFTESGPLALSSADATITAPPLPPDPRVTLSAGDLFILGFNADGSDDFSFITFVDLPSELTDFCITDNGLSNGVFRPVEGTLSYRAPAGGLKAGSVVVVTNVSGSGDPQVDEGSIDELSGMNFVSTGDQLILYQTNAASTNFIFALTTDSTNWLAATDSSKSSVPPGLTEGVDAIHINKDFGKGSDEDNGRYTNGLAGTLIQLRSLFQTPALWETSDGSGDQSFALSSEDAKIPPTGSVLFVH